MYIQSTNRSKTSSPPSARLATVNSRYDKNQNISFQSLGNGVIGKAAIGFFELMNSSIAASFLILDAFGMVLPRVWQAYNRNSDELGHKNSAAAIEELMRESLTGPSIVFFPILVSLGIARLAGKSIETPKHLLEEYLRITKNILGNKEVLKKGKAYLKNGDASFSNLEKVITKKFYKRLFNHAIPSDFPGKGKLMRRLKRELISNSRLTENHARSIVSNHNKLYGTFPGRPYNIYYPGKTIAGKQLDGDVAKLVTTGKYYVHDVIKKIVPHFDHPQVVKMVNNIQEKIKTGRIVTTVAGIVAVAAALRIIPSWYTSMHKVFPGLYGLGSYEYQDKISGGKE